MEEDDKSLQHSTVLTLARTAFLPLHLCARASVCVHAVYIHGKGLDAVIRLVLERRPIVWLGRESRPGHLPRSPDPIRYLSRSLLCIFPSPPSAPRFSTTEASKRHDRAPRPSASYTLFPDAIPRNLVYSQITVASFRDNAQQIAPSNILFQSSGSPFSLLSPCGTNVKKRRERRCERAVIHFDRAHTRKKRKNASSLTCESTGVPGTTVRRPASVSRPTPPIHRIIIELETAADSLCANNSFKSLPIEKSIL